MSVSNQFTKQELDKIEELKKYAKDNKESIIKEICGDAVESSDRFAVFMSGSPGAGKTEIAKGIKEESLLGQKINLVHIEQDRIKELLPGYTGENAPLYQTPATSGLSAVYKYVLKNGISFIMDTTLSNYEVAKRNIKNALKKNYKIDVYFVYQDPANAYRFVKSREKVEGRVVPKESFVAQFIESRITVNQLKQEFGGSVELNLVLKNITQDGRVEKEYRFNIECIDKYIGNVYKDKQEIYAIINNN